MLRAFRDSVSGLLVPEDEVCGELSVQFSARSLWLLQLPQGAGTPGSSKQVLCFLRTPLSREQKLRQGWVVTERPTLDWWQCGSTCLSGPFRLTEVPQELAFICLWTGWDSILQFEWHVSSSFFQGWVFWSRKPCVCWTWYKASYSPCRVKRKTWEQNFIQMPVKAVSLSTPAPVAMDGIQVRH